VDSRGVDVTFHNSVELLRDRRVLGKTPRQGINLPKYPAPGLFNLQFLVATFPLTWHDPSWGHFRPGHRRFRPRAGWLMLVQPAHTAPDFLASVQSGEHSGGHTQGLLPQTEINKIVEEYQDVFTPKDGCPPYRFDLSHTIRLQPGTATPYRRPYRLSPVEAQEVER
jgi:hypothetical protein